MNLNLLAISIGNTRTRIGGFVEGKLLDRYLTTHGDWNAFAETLTLAYKPLLDHEDVEVVMGSVNPRVADTVTKLVKERLGKDALRVERDLPIAIGRQLDRETLVGDDRLLNAAAAYDTLKQACVIVDAGTAMTVNFVDGVGTFHGGAILPGARMMLRAMHTDTAQLPEIELVRPEEPIGHNTAEAMRSGVFHGMRGAVRELVERYAEVAGAFPLVVATGGDAELLFSDFDLIDRVVPDLTLLGLAVTLRKSREAGDEE